MNTLARASNSTAQLEQIGPGAIRIGQLAALRIDLFSREVTSMLARSAKPKTWPSELSSKAFEAETGTPLAASFVGLARTAGEGNPLIWEGKARVPSGSDVLVRIAQPDLAPDEEQMSAALNILAPLLLSNRDRTMALASLRADITRWIASELDMTSQLAAIQERRSTAPRRSGTQYLAPLAAMCSANALTLRIVGGLTLPHMIALCEAGDRAMLAEYDIDPRRAADALLEAALEQVFVLLEVPVAPRPSSISVHHGNRIGRDTFGAVETLVHLQEELFRMARNLLSTTPSLVATEIDAQLEHTPDVNPRKFGAEVERATRLLTENKRDPAALTKWLEAVLSAAAQNGLTVPPAILAAGRWFTLIAGLALRIDPGCDLRGQALAYLTRRELEVLLQVPQGSDVMRFLLAVLDSAEMLPDQLDRLVAAIAGGHYRLPVVIEPDSSEVAAQIARMRLIGAALLWLGAALLHLAVGSLPGENVQLAASMFLWLIAALGAWQFVRAWRALQ